MIYRSKLLCLSLALVALPSTVSAGIVTYTSQAAFLADLSGGANTLDFDGTASGTVVNSGDTLGDITINHALGGGTGVEVIVTDGSSFGGPFSTTSGANFLGTDDGGVFQDGDNLDFSFAASNGFGLFVISADLLFNDDVTLSAGGTSIGLDASAGTLLSDGSSAFFLGIVDDMTTFTTADLVADSGVGPGAFLYNIDDITTSPANPVPEPSSLALLGMGAVSLCGYGWRRKRKPAA